MYFKAFYSMFLSARTFMFSTYTPFTTFTIKFHPPTFCVV